MGQLPLNLRDQKKEVSLGVIAAQPTLKAALGLCKAMSGLTDEQIGSTLGIDPAQFSRIFGNGAHFPPDKLLPFMELCGNVIPLIWLAHHSGYGLYRLKSKVEQDLEEERKKNEQLDLKLATLTEFFKGTTVKP